MPVWALKCWFCPLKCKFWGLKCWFCRKKDEKKEQLIEISRKGSLSCALNNTDLSAFSKRALHSTCLLTWYEVHFQSLLGGKGAVSGTVPLHTLRGTSQQEPCDTNVPSGLVPARHVSLDFFWAFLGHREGTRVAPGTEPLRNPKGTSRKACLENPDISKFGYFFASNVFLVRGYLAISTYPELCKLYVPTAVRQDLHVCENVAVNGRALRGPAMIFFISHDTVVAEMITELIRFEPEICICNGY